MHITYFRVPRRHVKGTTYADAILAALQAGFEPDSLSQSNEPRFREKSELESLRIVQKGKVLSCDAQLGN